MFSEFALHERLLKGLEELSFDTPTEVQQAAIPPAIAGDDLHVIAQTGSGKTAAFVVPLLQRLMTDDSQAMAPRALILLPTRELARQIISEVQKFAKFTFIKAELITGGEDFKVQAAKMRKNPDIIIATPGRMLDMGFTEDVMKLANACPPERQTLLFSATKGSAALRRVVEEVQRTPRLLQLNTVRDDTPAITQQVIAADDQGHKEALLKWILTNESPGKAIVFTNTRVMADRLNGVLRAMDMRVYVLHGEKDQKDRKLAIERLKQGHVGVLVATDVAARGLDIDELDLVINFDMPRSGDDYLHRIGRTGRAGAEGIAISLVAPHEWNLMCSIERYLRRQFERRTIKELVGSYKGPKKTKASGKPVGSKKKKDDKKKDGKKRPKTGKPAAKRKPAAPQGQVVTTSDGLAPPKKRS